MGISVCVEGVEQLDELKTVQTLNADSVQGYYVSRPIAREAFEAVSYTHLRPTAAPLFLFPRLCDDGKNCRNGGEERCI